MVTVRVVLANWLLKGNDMDIKILEKSLAGQRFVLAQSRNPVQIERVKKAIYRLENQILAIKKGMK
jgi:hypothetical protein